MYIYFVYWELLNCTSESYKGNRNIELREREITQNKLFKVFIILYSKTLTSSSFVFSFFIKIAIKNIIEDF